MKNSNSQATDLMNTFTTSNSELLSANRMAVSDLRKELNDVRKPSETAFNTKKAKSLKDLNSEKSKLHEKLVADLKTLDENSDKTPAVLIENAKASEKLVKDYEIAINKLNREHNARVTGFMKDLNAIRRPAETRFNVKRAELSEKLEVAQTALRAKLVEDLKEIDSKE